MSRWTPAARHYELEAARLRTATTKLASSEHPLDPSYVPPQPLRPAKNAPVVVTVKPDADFLDPLSMMAMEASLPLSMAAVGPTRSSAAVGLPSPSHGVGKTFTAASTSRKGGSGRSEPANAADVAGDGLPEWRAHRTRILREYTTTKRLAVKANFLEDDVGPDQGPKSSKERVERRVEHLTQADDERMSVMSQKSLIRFLEQYHDTLQRAWENGERVVCLKIAIQAAKLAGDTTVPQFYPSLFVLVAEILETFGKKVFERLLSLANVTKATFAAYSHADVPAEAARPAENWYYKTACIRELLPRFFIELTLMESYRMFEDDNSSAHLRRLGRTIRGVGDPLVATYARAFLALRGRDASPGDYKDVLLEGLEDTLFTLRQHTQDGFRAVPAVSSGRITAHEYVALLSPAFEWTIAHLAHEATEVEFFAVLEACADRWASSVVLVHVLRQFPAALIAARASDLVETIRKADCSVVPASELFKAFGRALVACPPPRAEQMPLLNAVWREVSAMGSGDVVRYVEVAQVWVGFILPQFGFQEANTLLRDVVKHVKKRQAYLRPEIQAALHAMVVQVMGHVRGGFDALFAMDQFLPIVDLLARQHKSEASSLILRQFVVAGRASADPVIVHSLIGVAKLLHDSLDALSLSDEQRRVTQLLIDFVRLIEFNNDLERQLAAFTACRAAFANLDAVVEELVRCACAMAMKAHRVKRGRHNKRTSAFVKACVAFCHITIPSLDSTLRQLRLFQLAAHVALVNALPTLGEALAVSALQCLSTVPALVTLKPSSTMQTSTEPLVAAWTLSFCSTALLVPGHPTNGPFHLVTGLFAAMSEYEPWQALKGAAAPDGARVSVHLTAAMHGLVRLLVAMGQPRFALHLAGITSNDELYGSSAAYLGKLDDALDALIKHTMKLVARAKAHPDLADEPFDTQAAALAALLLELLDLTPPSAAIVTQLLKLADADTARGIVDRVRARPGMLYRELGVAFE